MKIALKGIDVSTLSSIDLSRSLSRLSVISSSKTLLSVVKTEKSSRRNVPSWC